MSGFGCRCLCGVELTALTWTALKAAKDAHATRCPLVRNQRPVDTGDSDGRGGSDEAIR